jgi:FkbM family methyltransferase
MNNIEDSKQPNQDNRQACSPARFSTFRMALKQFPLLYKLARMAYYSALMEPEIEPYDLSPEKIQKLLNKPNPIIIEIGCHDGENTQWFIDRFQNPQIHCFEPDPRVIEKFRRRFSTNISIHLHPFALGESIGRMPFYQSFATDPGSDWDASGSLMHPKNHLKEYNQVKFGLPIDVEVKTLDVFCKENAISEVDLIWMDVQGAELKVISGGRHTFNLARYIVTEYSNKEQPRLKTLLSALSKHRVVKRYPDDVLLQRR